MPMQSLLVAVAVVAVEPVLLCPVQQVAGAPNENHVLFHGVSPDGRTLAIGWDRGTAPNIERGAYLLDLASGRRTELPHLNNAPSFSPDGRYLVSANYPVEPALGTEVV